MSIKKEDNKWLVDIRPSGRNGKRYRRKFEKKAEALAYEKHILATAHSKEWLGLPADKRPLSALIEIWWKKSGQFKRTADNYQQKVNLICRELGDPPINTVNHKLLSNWVIYRLEKGQKPSTIRRLIKSLSNIFTVTINSGDYVGENPLTGLTLPTVKQPEMTYLNDNQIDQLLEAVAGHDELNKVVEICLSTGSRWRETITLRTSNLSPYKIRFTNTKTDKPRTVPISQELYEKIYPKKGASVLRHTFASHFVMEGGDILTLRDILGHSDIKQTMTYSHLAPDHLTDAVKLNPLSKKRQTQ